MSLKVTVELPEELAERARAVAARFGRPLETTLVELIDRGVGERAVDLLPDDQVLALCDGEMEAGQQEELHEFLDRNREGALNKSEHDRLDQLMALYRRGLLLKAQAWRIAVRRGLKSSLA